MSQATDWFRVLLTLALVRGFGQGALSVVSMAMIQVIGNQAVHGDMRLKVKCLFMVLQTLLVVIEYR